MGIWSGNGIMNGSSGIFDPDVAGAGIHTLVYSYVDGNSCENSDTVLVTVNGLPYVDAGLDTNLCNQADIVVTLSGSPVEEVGVEMDYFGRSIYTEWSW